VRVAFRAPDEVTDIVGTLQRAGHETWCVGGAVRDALRGNAHLDWDLATSATPDIVQRLFKRTVPVGVEFGTVGVLDKKGRMHEVTTFRRDVKTDGRHAVVEFGASLDDDLARRDLTINAMAFDPSSGDLRDPFDGQTDLKRGIVRAVGDAATRMREDRLRALRALRFAARFEFNIEPATWAAIKESAPHLTRLSAERVKQELEKTMQQVARPSAAMEWWWECGALAVLVPAVADAPRERFEALDRLPMAELALNRLSLLFLGSDPREVAHAVKALRFSNADGAWISHLAAVQAEIGAQIAAAVAPGASAPGGSALGAAAPSDAEIRRWLAKVGRTRAAAFFALQAALHNTDAARALAARADEAAFRDPIEVADLAVDGEDLVAAGVPKGPAVGKTLRHLLDAVIADPAVNTRGRLLELALTAQPAKES